MAAGRLSFRLTKGGWVLVLLCVLLTLGAINADLNLTYLLTSLLIALLLASVATPVWSVLRLKCRRAICGAAFAGEQFAVHFWVYSARRTTARMVRIEDPLGTDERGHAVRALAWRIPAHGRIRLCSMLRAGKRGVYALPGLTWSSGFPFGLARCGMKDRPGGELVVYPARGRLSAAAAAGLKPRGMRGRTASRLGVICDEFRSVREYRPGDSLRLIHWRATAHLSKLCVREMEHERAASLLVLLDSRIPAWLSGSERKCTSTALELAISYVAELCRVSLDAGRSVELAGFFPQPRLIRVGAAESGRPGSASPSGGFFTLLEALARLQPSDAETAGNLLEPAELAGMIEGRQVAAVTPVPETADTFSDLLARFGIAVLVASDPSFSDTFKLAGAGEEEGG